MTKRLALAALVVAAVATPASASVPDIVTVTYNPWVVCVTDPCPQPVPVTVCVNVPTPAAVCTPK
jgi:hypothetical protein